MDLNISKLASGFLQWLKDRSIKNKLIISISICAISMLIIGFTSLRDLSVIQKDLSDISQFYLKGILYLLELDKDLHQGLLSERNMMLTKNDPEQFRKFFEKYNKDIERDIEKRWEKGFLTLKEDWNEEEQKLIDEYERERDDWLKFSKNVIKSLQEKSNGDIDDLIKQTLTVGFEKFTKMRESINHLTKIYTEQSEIKDLESQETYKLSVIIQISVIILALLFSVLFGIIIVNLISKPVKMVVENLQMIAKGKLNVDIELAQKDELGKLANAYNDMSDYLKKSSQVATAIGQGNYDIPVEIRSNEDMLGNAIYRMKDNLQIMTEENATRDWYKTGQAELGNKMRGDQKIQELSQNIITYLAGYLKASVGAIFLLKDDKILKLSGSYANKKRKKMAEQFKIGEGLVGQVAIEKKSILVTDVPEDYIKINSGIGEAIPLNLMVSPFMYDEEIIGVIELGSFKEFSDKDKDFLELCSENIAIAIQSAQSRGQVKELLAESQNQAEELQTQQEELRVTNEEMQTQQEELRVTNEEPLSISLSTIILPPSSSIIVKLTDKPRPVPFPIAFVVKNGSKILSI